MIKICYFVYSTISFGIQIYSCIFYSKSLDNEKIVFSSFFSTNTSSSGRNNNYFIK